MDITISKQIYGRNTAPAQIAALLKDSGVSVLDAYEAVDALRTIGVLKMRSLQLSKNSTGVSEEVIRKCIDVTLKYPDSIFYRLGEEAVKAYNADDKRTS